MESKQVTFLPPISLFVAASGRSKYLYWHKVYVTDTIVNGRVLLKSTFGNVSAGWLELRQVKKLQEKEKKLLKNAIMDAFWRRQLCPHCINLECVSNFSPCYQCRRGDRYQEDRKCF